MKTYEIAMPWVFRQLGVIKWLRDRLLHLPEAALESAALTAGVTPEQWRAVERTQAQLVEGKLKLRLTRQI